MSYPVVTMTPIQTVGDVVDYLKVQNVQGVLSSQILIV